MRHNCWFDMDCKLILDECQILNRLKENRVVVLNVVHSTNQYIIDNLRYMQSGDVFVTGNQTHGRGRYGKFWITPNAQSIALSMYWRIYQELLITTKLSLMVSFVIAKVLQELGVSQVQIKWPNDLYISDRKLGGVLIEVIREPSKVIHVIIGVGINIYIYDSAKLTIKIGKNWIDLKSIGVFFDHNIFIADLVKKLRFVMKQVECNQYILLDSFYSQELDYLYNQPIAILFRGNVNYGTVIGINKDGVLLVKDQFGIICQYLKDNVSVYRV